MKLTKLLIKIKILRKHTFQRISNGPKDAENQRNYSPQSFLDKYRIES